MAVADLVGDREPDRILHAAAAFGVLAGQPVQQPVRGAGAVRADQQLLRCAAGTWAIAADSTAMWSAVVLEPAFPGRSVAASISWVLSHHTPMGWYPNPPLNVAAAASFSECASHQGGVDVQHDRLAEVGAGDLRGRKPAAGGELRPHVAADLGAGLLDPLSAAGVSSSSVRHTVGADATGPSTWPWWRSTSMSAIASPPSASSTARSTSTRPRSWTGRNDAPRQRRRQAAGQPDPVRQQPHRHGPGVRHHPGPVGRDRQPGRPRHMLHLRSAFPFRNS